MKRKISRKKLIEKLNEIDQNILIDLIYANFNEFELEKAFKFERKMNFNDIVIYLVKELFNGDPLNRMDTIIRYNNAYVEQNRYNELTEKELKKEFSKNQSKGINGTGITPEQLILYYFTESNLEFINFLIKSYKKSIRNMEFYKKDTMSKMPKLPSLLNSTVFKKEFEFAIQNGYAGYNDIDFEGLGKDFNVSYNKENKTYIVPQGFLLFFNSKILEIFSKLEFFNSAYGILHGNINKINEQLRLIVKEREKLTNEREAIKKEKQQFKNIESQNKKLLKEIEKIKNNEIILENEKLKKENNYLFSSIEKLENEIKEMLEDEENEIVENIETEAFESVKINFDNFKNKKIKLIGGKWNSKSKEEVELFFDGKNSEIEFIPADNFFRKFESLKTVDLIIFDTSYNSHKSFYKLKTLNNKKMMINSSNLASILK